MEDKNLDDIVTTIVVGLIGITAMICYTVIVI